MIIKFKIFENQNWNQILHSATWVSRPKNSKGYYKLDFDNIKLAVKNGV